MRFLPILESLVTDPQFLSDAMKTSAAVQQEFDGLFFKRSVIPTPDLGFFHYSVLSYLAQPSVHTNRATPNSGFAGTLFSLNIDGTGFSVVHQFTGSDGYGPMARLVLSSNMLYGTTHGGGI